MNSHLKKTALAALAVVTIGGFEGLRQTAYPDPATRGHPWTICYGHTGPDVHPGERDAIAQCKQLLLADLGREADGIDACVHTPLSDGQYVAVLSLAHNMGVGGACRSAVVREINEGHVAAGCEALLEYTRAAGMVLPGLVRRRQQERALCLAK